MFQVNRCSLFGKYLVTYLVVESLLGCFIRVSENEKCRSKDGKREERGEDSHCEAAVQRSTWAEKDDELSVR